MQSHRNDVLSGSVDYDVVSANYDRSRKASKADAGVLLDLLSPLMGSRILEIGCGTANYLAQLESLAGHVTGLDLSEGMLKTAQSKVRNADLIRADAVLIPFHNSVFDAVYCVQVLHHIRDKSAFASETLRILKPGGRLVIQSCSHEQLSTFCFYHYFPRGLKVDRLRMPDIGVISDLLSAAGFDDITIQPCAIDDAVKDAPEDYLDKRNRDGDSTFHFLTTTEIEDGCKRIRRDIQSGKANRVAEELRERAEEIGGQVSFVRAVKR
ncbi:class I SAM-dependent methyltransferase [Candidatus Hydrogenedentota bacterium]